MSMKRSGSTKASGHRTRAGQQKRLRTRERILAAAVEIYPKAVTDSPVIDDFIKAAGVARGTFYNYFKSTEEVLEATAKWLEDDLIVAIVAEMDAIKAPAQRVATGIRLWMAKADADPAWCAFIARYPRRGQLVEKQLTSDLRAGLRAGTLVCPSLGIARDLVVGTIREAMVRMVGSRVPSSFGDDVTRALLRGLGVPEDGIGPMLEEVHRLLQRRARETGDV